MSRINFARFVLGVFIAGVFYFIADGIVHGGVLSSDYEAAITGAGKKVEEDPSSYVYFAVFDLGKAFIAMFVYVLGRERFGPGVATAVRAGLVAWLGVEVLPAIAGMPFPFYEKAFYWKVIGLELVPMVLGAILGAWPYKEP